MNRQEQLEKFKRLVESDGIVKPAKVRKKYLWRAYLWFLVLAWVAYFSLMIAVVQRGSMGSEIIFIVMSGHLFVGLIFIIINLAVYLIVRKKQRARKIVGRILVCAWMAVLLFLGIVFIHSAYLQSEYEQHYRPFTQSEIEEHMRACNIKSVESENESWQRLYLYSGGDRAVLASDVEAAHEQVSALNLNCPGL